MNDSEKVRVRSYRFERYAWALAVVWTVVIAASLVWNVIQVTQNTLEAARIQARTVFEKDVIYRRWNAEHGGVYVPVTEETQPNAYLTDMPERDITTLSGRQLTLMNPAYMTRQVHELAEEEYGVRGHITSLNPIRPENAPDPWETEALRAFERGQTEISSVEEIEGEEYMRLMRPLITEKGCLKCHAKQGYQEGDIRGGISVSIRMEPLKAIANVPMLTLGLGHVLLWLMGLGGIVLATQRLRQRESERKRTEEQLRFQAQLLDNVRESVVATDIEGHIIYWGQGAEALYGYRPEEIMGKLITFIVEPQEEEEEKRRMRQVRETGSWSGQYVQKRKDGASFWADTFISLVRDQNGQPYGLIGIDRDITERKQAEEQIKAALQEKEVLLKEIHHRVKNNLQVVHSLLDFQSQYVKDEQALEMLRESQNRVRSMAIIHEKLHQSKDLARIDFAEHVRDLTDYLFMSYGVNPEVITLQINVNDIVLDVDTAISCSLIINELVSNALKHAFPAGREGEIYIDLRADNDDQLTLMVSNNGVGFPEDLDFRNTESLGLRLVDMLTRQLKGTIELDRGHGTAFKITFARPER